MLEVPDPLVLLQNQQNLVHKLREEIRYKTVYQFKNAIIEILKAQIPFATAQSLVYTDWEKVCLDIKSTRNIRATKENVFAALDFLNMEFPNVCDNKTYEYMKKRITEFCN
jgi:hypothetical protein